MEPNVPGLKSEAQAGHLRDAVGVSVSLIADCLVAINPIGVSVGSCLTHHLVSVGIGAISEGLVSNASTAFFGGLQL